MELKKSIDNLLYDRLSSPFYGTFLFSWLVWNWKLWYVTFFISQDKLKEITKLDYISSHLNLQTCFFNPLYSTIVLLTLGNVIASLVFWLELRFAAWRRKKKNKVELVQTIAFDVYAELREKMENQARQFNNLLNEGRDEIKFLKEQLANADAAAIRADEFYKDLHLKLESAQQELSSVEFRTAIEEISYFFKNENTLATWNGVEKIIKEKISQRNITNLEFFKGLLQSLLENGAVQAMPDQTYRFSTLGKMYSSYYKSLAKNQR